MVKEDALLTIVTATYNRAGYLRRLYDSLVNQGSKKFIWIIIDDGSTDDTEEIVKNFVNDDFPVIYRKKDNGGKHTALNYGIPLIKTPYTFIVDSDDYLFKNAIELVYQWILEIADDPRFAGVAGNRMNESNNSIIGSYPNKEYVDCLNSQRVFKHLLGDKAEIYKTDLLRSNPFPVFDGEKFIPESVVWNKISDMGLMLRWHKESLVKCGYLENGLTSSVRSIDAFKKNYNGFKEDFRINFRTLPFPFNYSAASVFYAKCIAINNCEKCLDNIEISFLKRILIRVLGRIRFLVNFPYN